MDDRHDDIKEAATREEAQALLDAKKTSDSPPPGIVVEVLQQLVNQKPRAH